MASNPQAYPASEILHAIQDRLVDGLGIDEAYVRLVNNDQYRVTFEDTLIALRPLGPTPVTDAGGGRFSRPVSRTLRVYIHKRSSVDFAGDDSTIVGEICDLEDEVFDLLDDWFVTNSNREIMTIEPLHPTDSSNGPPVRNSVDDVGENFSFLSFEIRYLLSSDRTVPE